MGTYFFKILNGWHLGAQTSAGGTRRGTHSYATVKRIDYKYYLRPGEIL